MTTGQRREDFLPADRGQQAPNAGRFLLLLFAANTFNFYDRAIPAIVAEPIKVEFALSDLDIGILAAAFTVVYALCGLPLGRLADHRSRAKIMGWGLVAWSALTAASGAAWNYTSLLLLRIGVGVGEASYAPAANSTIADLYPAEKRARAIGLFQLGLPVGLILAYFSVGAITEAFGSWRAPFVLAAVPGILIAIGFFLVREPRRGASEATPAATGREKVDRPFRRILAVPTMWWLIIAGIGANLAAYSVNTFTVPLFQRYFGASLTGAAALTGVVVGITGLVGLLAGGWISDRAARRSSGARVLVGAVATLLSVPLTWFALTLGPEATGTFVLLFGVGWLLQYLYYTSAYPAVADVVPPRLRSTATAVFFAAFYLLGGAIGPVIAGALSDSFAATAMAAGTGQAEAAAIGLRQALSVIVPISMLITAVGLFLATRTVQRDNERMKAATATG
ncbi:MULTISPECIES: MFS transporter [unclassified Pseudonocardia]|uniref:spinster family MFS transporter n=1 Tax=unclassified Pseudonocardia TaxID=2619320 RepID=UPI0001FFDF71|nr:MFS transporter [Pseudonocardia sp. Ae707_Ps1]OLM17574.1 Major facilitator family transporter [Pseudonocardia sp. Ae707_Ps1]